MNIYIRMYLDIYIRTLVVTRSHLLLGYVCIDLLVIQYAICIHLYFTVFIIHSLVYMVYFSFINMDIQTVSNPYKCVFS